MEKGKRRKLEEKKPGVLIIGTLDTKAEEISFVKSLLSSLGIKPILMDIGVFGSGKIKPDISLEKIGEGSGLNIAQLKEKRDAGFAVAQIAEAVAKVSPQLVKEWKVSGVLSIGGGKGAAIASAAMQRMPFGLPKVMLTSASPGNARRFMGHSDILLLFSPADMMGINPITKALLNNAANAIAGMAIGYTPEGEEKSKFVAISSFGVTTPAVMRCKELIESAGYQTVVFPASGLGGMALEQSVLEGKVSGVLDITTTELADEIAGGIASAGPERLEAAGKMGIPQVIGPGAIDMVNFGPPETVPPNYADRRFYRHSPQATLMRTNTKENAEMGRITAMKLNRSKGPAAVVIPQGGFSAYDSPKGPWYDPDADQAYIDALRNNLSPAISFIEVEGDINGEAFCQTAVKLLLNRIKSAKSLHLAE
jgi:uncharacterized protein (UPF0261 family)